MESDAAAVRFREGNTTASSTSTPRGRASVIVRGMARRGGSLRRALKHLTIGSARDANSGPKLEGSPSGKERVASADNIPENVEMLEVRRNGVSDDDKSDKTRSTWSERYSTWRRSLKKKKTSENAELPPPPDDAVVPKTCCSFSR